MYRDHPSGLIAEYSSLPDLLTAGDAYVDVGVWDAMLLATKHFAFTAAAKDLDVRILGSIDGGATFPFTAEAEFTVAAGATVTKTITTYYTHLKVQVKPNAAGQNGTLSTRYAGASF